MRKAIVLLMIMSIAGSAVAQDLGATRDLSVKKSSSITYVPPAQPKQGGDNMDDAVVIPGIPYTNSGTTVGYLDDYDVACTDPSTSPDVIYSFTPAADIDISVDLCGSSYDTKTFVFDGLGNVVACDDDFYGSGGACGDWVSFIQRASLLGGTTYFIAIDGWGGASGDYELEIREFEVPDPCVVACDPDAVPEGEPRLMDGYVDNHNGGCNTDPVNSPFMDIDWTNDTDGVPPYDGSAFMCGESGWFTSGDGGASRDTDWFRVFALETGTMEMTVQAEWPTSIFKLAPMDCPTVAVELSATTDCTGATLSFPVTEGEEVWLWVGPSSFDPPPGVTDRNYIYSMTITNNMFGVVPSEKTSFGSLKALYR